MEAVPPTTGLLRRALAPRSAFREVSAAVQLLRRGNYLQRVGWFQSCELGYSVDRHGRALPWYTYPAIAFLEPRLSPTMRVFEFGSGQSTLWYAQRVAEVISCEHSCAWYEHVAKRKPSNVTLLYRVLNIDGDYSKSANSYGPTFDLIVIDGEDRTNCAKNAVQALKESGVIIFDNTEHEANWDGMRFLKNRGFKQIEFEGMAPGVPYHSWTSFYYRPGNCLSI